MFSGLLILLNCKTGQKVLKFKIVKLKTCKAKKIKIIALHSYLFLTDKKPDKKNK
jgi:hypothetical protein